MGDLYTELFRIPFTGNASDLKAQLRGLDGIQSVSLGTNYEVVDGEVDCELQYDTHETDRTLLAEQIEAIKGTGHVTFG